MAWIWAEMISQPPSGQVLDLVHQGGGGVLRDHKAAVQSGVGHQKGGQTVVQVAVDHAVGAPFHQVSGNSAGGLNAHFL